MSNRLDKERETKLQPARMKYAVDKITDAGYEITHIGETYVQFVFNGNSIRHYPYSGWHTGKGIVDGRGIKKLLNQIKKHE